MTEAHPSCVPPGTPCGGGSPDDRPVADALVVSFTTGMSLAAWRSAGMLTREWALCDRLRERYGRLVLVSYGGPEDLQIARTLGPRLHLVANDQGLDTPRFLAGVPGRVATLLADARSAVVKTNQMDGGHVALAVTRALRARGVRTALVARGGYLWSRFVAYETGPGSQAAKDAGARERELCLHADVIVGTSQAMLGDLCWRYAIDASRAKLIPNFVVPNAPMRTAEEREKAQVLYAGQLVVRKRVDLLIEALSLLREGGNTQVTLHVIGEGPELPRLQALAHERNVPVTFEPRVSHEQLLDRMSRCTVYAQASTLEGHPKTVIEAMSTGAPVVVVSAPGLGRVVQHAITGLVMAPEAAAIARAIDGLIGDPAWRDALGGAAALDINTNLSLDRIVRLEEDAHRLALANAGAAPTQPMAQVRFDPDLLDAAPEAAADLWGRSLHAYLRRLPDDARAAFLAHLDHRLNDAGAPMAASGIVA